MTGVGNDGPLERELKEPTKHKSTSSNLVGQADSLESISTVFGVDGEYWPNYVQLAVMLTAHFPESILSIYRANPNLRLELSYQGLLLATVDEVGIRFQIDIRDQDWEGIYEGDVFTVARHFLEDLSKLGYIIYEPKRTYKFGNLVKNGNLLS